MATPVAPPAPAAAEPAQLDGSPCVGSVIAFDFVLKTERTLSLSEARTAMDAGHLVWVDITIHDTAEARRILESFGLLDPEVIEAALSKEPTTQHARYEQYLHLVVSECRPVGSGFEEGRLDVVLSEKLFLTIHEQPLALLAALRKDYRNDFLRFAKTPSFLVYEVWDHLLDGYLRVQKLMEERVEQLQNELRSDRVSEKVFARISELTGNLLQFRKIVLPARSVLSDLATRRSVLLSETTQSFLANMVGTVEHVLHDLLVDRDILSEALNLHMSILSHRTNEVMKKLTAVSVVFLPLSFLAGVYGTNFDHLPELQWRHGYLYFWLAVLAVTAGLLLILRRARLF
jgi:magnesium transporter